MGVDVYSIYISADGEVVPEFLAAIPSDYYTTNQVYNKTEIDVKLMNIDMRIDETIGNINAVLDQINGEEV